MTCPFKLKSQGSLVGDRVSRGVRHRRLASERSRRRDLGASSRAWLLPSRPWWPLLAVAVMTISNGASAQDIGKLPVSIVVDWSFVRYDRPVGTAGSQTGTRFGGGALVAIGHSWFIGLRATSWVRSIEESPGSDQILASRAEADLYHLLLERIVPVGRFGIVLRGGAGLAHSESLTGSGVSIQRFSRWRSTVLAGAGLDIKLQDHLYLTPGLSYTAILSSDPTHRELRHGFSVGLALTLR
jgi:hypothetical protein